MQSRNELLYKLETSINKLRKFCCPDFDEINSKEYYKIMVLIWEIKLYQTQWIL